MRLLLIAVLLLTFATPTMADKKQKSQKIKVDNQAIDRGMIEAGEKADIAYRKKSSGRNPTGKKH